MSTAPLDPQVPNPYREAIEERRRHGEEAAEILHHTLDRALRALEAGAWVGGRADEFHAALQHHRMLVRRAGERALDEFDAARAAQPPMVDSDSWQVRWQRLGPW